MSGATEADAKGSVTLYPAWREAEKKLLAAKVEFGAIISRAWLDEVLGIKPPKTVREVRDSDIERLQQITALRDSLLKNHCMMLDPIPGEGYKIVRPEEQTKVAMRKRSKEMKRAIKGLTAELTHVRTDLLSTEQRAENSNAIAKVGALKALSRKQLRLE
jgi:hypothetical protein